MGTTGDVQLACARDRLRQHADVRGRPLGGVVVFAGSALVRGLQGAAGARRGGGARGAGWPGAGYCTAKSSFGKPPKS